MRVRYLRRTSYLLVAVVVLTYAGAWLMTDRSGAARAIVWLGADTGDIDRFPTRPVRAGGQVRELPPGEPLDLAAAWGVPDPVALLDDSGTAAFLVLQDGRLRYEHYGEGSGPQELRPSFSVVKSVVSTLVGLALEEGHVRSLDDPVTDYVPELLERDERFGDIRVRDLLTMSSGLAYEERPLPWSDDAQTYYGTDLRGTALSARVAGPPGTHFLYNNYNLLLEGLVLERATGTTVADYLSTRLWGPMGAEADASWSLDSTRSGFEKMESGLNAVARDYARFGQLVLDEGRVGDRQVVPAAWLRSATDGTAAGGASDTYGFHWWSRVRAGPLPPSHFLARGNLGQFVYVAPDRDVVVVRLGDDVGDVDWGTRLVQVVEGT